MSGRGEKNERHTGQRYRVSNDHLTLLSEATRERRGVAPRRADLHNNAIDGHSDDFWGQFFERLGLASASLNAERRRSPCPSTRRLRAMARL
jgi:hypothetical protein